MVNVNSAFTVDGNGFYIDQDTGVWIGGGASVPTINAPQGSKYYLIDPSVTYTQVAAGFNNTWVADNDPSNNIDGGNASTVYPAIDIDGGGA